MNMKNSSSTHGKFIKRFYKTNRSGYGKYSISVSAVESSEKQLLVIFTLNCIDKLIDLEKICMTLLVPKNIQKN